MKHDDQKQEQISDAVRLLCQRSFGVLDSNFLCQSLSMIEQRRPVCVSENTTLEQVVEQFQRENIGAVLVVNDHGRLSGVFTERDCILRVINRFQELKHKPISEFMTKNPVCEAPDVTVAFALNLMSHGNFRHIPLVDEEGVPIGIVSVRDVVDFITARLTEDLMTFEVGH